MAWYNPGGGAGVWDAAKVDTDLRNILAQLCHAVNEREMYRSASRLSVTSITRALTVATVTTAASHSLSTGNYVFIIGAAETEYNGIHQITVTGASTFTFTVSGTPATPATGTIKYVKQTAVTSFTYDDEFNTKPFPTASDFDGMPLHQITRHERKGYAELTVSSLTRSGTTATLTVSSTAGITTGDYVEVGGANQAAYNGVQQVVVASGTTLTYTVAGAPATPATGTITAWHQGRVTQAGGTAKVRLIGHGLHTGHYVELSGCTPSDYNGVKQISLPSIIVSSITRSGSTATVTTSAAHGLSTNDIVAIVGATQTEYNQTAALVTVTGSTTFTYPVTGSPATPATGSIVLTDQSHFTFTIDSGVAAMATGNIKITTPSHMIYRGTYSGGTARMYCKEHGFSVGQWVEVVNEDSSHTTWRFWGPVTAISANEYFEIAASGVTGADIGHGTNDTDVAFWANRVIGIRKPMREIQAAIEGLLTASTAATIIRFVEDSSPYETNYTLANLLDAGSYGSSWLSLMGRSVETVSDALLQMKEALDLLVVMTVTGTATIDAHDVYTSYQSTSGIGVDTVDDDDPTYFVIVTNENHRLTAGDSVLFLLDIEAGVSGSLINKAYRETPNITDAVTIELDKSSDIDSYSQSGNFIIPEITAENAWDNAVGGSPETTASGSYLSRRVLNKQALATGVDLIAFASHDCTVEYDADGTFTITPMAGNFVVGKIYLRQSHFGDQSQDSYTLTDSDTDTYAIDATLGTTNASLEKSKTGTFFEQPSRTLTFTTPTPATNPFSSALGDDESTQRRVDIATVASKHTRELAPGTHLTYG